MANYPSSLTDSEWEIVRAVVPEAQLAGRGRPCNYSKREILDAILYIVRGGIPWRMLGSVLVSRFGWPKRIRTDDGFGADLLLAEKGRTHVFQGFVRTSLVVANESVVDLLAHWHPIAPQPA